MNTLYLPSRKEIGGAPTDAVLIRLQRVCALLDAILQSDRSRYLEARTWLLNTIASECPPAGVRLACWEPLLAEALAAPTDRSPPPAAAPAYPDKGGGGDHGRPHGVHGRSSEGVGKGPGRGEPPRSPGRREEWLRRDAGGEAACGAVGGVPGPMEQLTQLLMLVSEVWPDKVTALLLDRPQVFVDFFQGPGSSRRILLWFSHFSMDGMRAFKYGSRALAHYALAHREEVWELLRWEGKHPQAPVAVAAKTHYFCELALVASVRSLLRHHPRFFASVAWRECCKDGAVLELDRRHFCEVLLNDLRDSDRDPASVSPSVGDRVAALLRDFLSAPANPRPGTTGTSTASDGHPHWRLLCQRLLHQLDERQLLRLINTLAAGQRMASPPFSPAVIHSSSPAADAATPPERAAGGVPVSDGVGSRGPELVHAHAGLSGGGGWQDLSGLALSGGAQWSSVGQAVVVHALAAARGQLQRLLADERDELAGMLEEVEVLAGELHGAPGGGGGVEAAEGCSPAAHMTLLHCGRLDLAGPGRRCAEDRLLLLVEMWTLREALRRRRGPQPAPAGARASWRPPSGTEGDRGGGGGGLSIRDGGGAAARDGDARGGGSGYGDGDDPDTARLPLERVMAELRGVTFERLHGASTAVAAARGPPGLGLCGARAAVTMQLPANGADVASPAAAAAGAAAAMATAGAGQYELLPSEDEELGRRVADGRHRRDREQGKARARSRGRSSGKPKRKRRCDEGGRSHSRSRHGSKRKRRHRRQRGRGDSESPDRSRSHSRSRGRGGGRRGRGSNDSRSSSGEGEDGRGWRGSREGGKSRKRRHASTTSSNSTGSSSSDSRGATSSHDSSDGEGSRRERRERCGSSGLDDPRADKRRAGRHRRRRSHGGPQDSRRSSALPGSAQQSWRGGPRTDSSGELGDLDPLTLLNGLGGDSAIAWSCRGRGGGGADVVWRVWMPGVGAGDGKGSRTAAGGGDASAVAAAGAAAGAVDWEGGEVVGGCDDVADLLAAAACKHWVAAALLRGRDGAERRRR